MKNLFVNDSLKAVVSVPGDEVAGWLQVAASAKKKAKGAPDRMIVVSRSAGNISWLPLFFGTTPTTIMQLVNMTEHRTGCWEGGCPSEQASADHGIV